MSAYESQHSIDPAWYLPVVSSRYVDGAQARMAMRKLLSVMTRLWEPCELAFVTSMTPDGALAMGWQVKAESATRSQRFLRDLRTACQQVAPWLDFGEPTTDAPWPAPGPARYCLERAATDTGDLIPVQSLVWPAVKEMAGKEPYTSVLAFDVLPDPMESAYDSRDWAAGGHGIDPDHPASEGELLLRYTVHGPDEGMRLFSALVAEDTAGEVGLRECPVSTAAQITALSLPAPAVAHLLAVPARVRGLLPERSPRPAEELFELMESGASPHVLVQGQTGGGKSTLLEHLIARSLEHDRSVFVVDIHDGALIRQGERLLRERGEDPLVVNFGRPDHRGDVSVMSFTRPPRGVDPRQFAHDQAALLVADLHDGGPMLREHHAAVGQRGLLTQVQILCLDPAATPVTAKDIPRLLDPAEKEFRRDILARIGDLDLARSLVKEIMPTLEARDPENAAIWWIGKWQPLLATPQIRAIACGEGQEVDFETAFAEERSVLVHAPSSALGESGARIITAQVINRFWIWALAQGNRVAYDLFADEWQNNPTSTFARMLAESRKVGVRLRLSNQSTEQLPPKLRDAALANVGSLVTFATSRRDAEVIEGLYPSITVGGLQRLPKHHVAVTNRDRDLVAETPRPLTPVPPAGDIEVGTAVGAGASMRREESERVPEDDPRWDALFGVRRRSGTVEDNGDPRSFLDEWLEERRRAGLVVATETGEAGGVRGATFARAARGRATQDRIVVGGEVVSHQARSYVDPQASMFAIVDGMSGRPAGAKAADVLAQSIADFLDAAGSESHHWSKRAQLHLERIEQEQPEFAGLGARAAVAWTHAGRRRIERVGDIICLWLDDDGMHDLDALTPEGAGLCAVESSSGAPLRIDRYELPQHTRRILMASDGARALRTRQELGELLASGLTSLGIVKKLEAEAPIGPLDDISILCVDLAQGEVQTPR